MNLRTAAISVVASAAVVLAAAGCSETIEGSPRPAGATAPTTSGGAPEPANGAYGSVEELLTAIAEQQREDETVRFELTGEGFPIEGSGVSRLDENGSASSITISAAEFGEIEGVLLPGELYLKLPAGSGLDTGKPWVKITGEGGGPFAALLGPLLEQLGSSTDPTAQLKAYGDAVTITGSRDDERDGLPVMVYDLAVDTAAIAGGPGVPGLPEGIPLPGSMTITMAVDGEDRLHDVKVTTDVQGTPLVITTTFSEWGEPVDIQAPPPDQVGEIPGF